MERTYRLAPGLPEDDQEHFSALAAYQIEFSVTNILTKIVGIEGGQHPAFREPPFYDPKAMQQERVIIAAFSTDNAEPYG